MTRFATYLIGLVLTCQPATAAEQVKFILDWAFQGIHGLFTLADDNGHFAKEGLAVKIDRGYGSGDTITKVSAGTYDIGLADVNSLVAFNAKNPGNKVVSFFHSLRPVGSSDHRAEEVRHPEPEGSSRQDYRCACGDQHAAPVSDFRFGQRVRCQFR